MAAAACAGCGRRAAAPRLHKAEESVILSSSMPIMGAIFDLDGTVYPYSRLIANSVRFALRYPRFFAHFAKVRIELRRIRPVVDFRATQAALLARSMRIPVAQARLMIEEIIYQRLEESFRGIRPYAFLREALQGLRDSGRKLAVLSDFPVERKLQYLGLDDLWDCTLSSEETGYLKPNPEPFLAVADRLNLAPQAILFVGDKYLYDILGAHRVGMRTAHLTRVPENHGVADITFRSYANFVSMVKRVEAVGGPQSADPQNRQR